MKTFTRQSGQKERKNKLTIEMLATKLALSLFAEPIDWVFANHSCQWVLRQVPDEGDAKEIVTLPEGLKGTKKMQKISKKDASLRKRFAANERKHLIVENAILLPLAKVRLSGDDQRKLGMRMAARRGTEMSKVAHD